MPAVSAILRVPRPSMTVRRPSRIVIAKPPEIAVKEGSCVGVRPDRRATAGRPMSSRIGKLREVVIDPPRHQLPEATGRAIVLADDPANLSIPFPAPLCPSSHVARQNQDNKRDMLMT